MSLLTVAELKAQIKTSRSDDTLQNIIDREESAINRLVGAPYSETGEEADTVTETMAGDGMRNLYLRRRFSDIESITEDDVELTGGAETDWREWPSEGRVERLPAGCRWGSVVVIEYIPADDNNERKAAIVELVRLALDRTALASENVAGEYSYTAPEWEERRREITARLMFSGV